MQFIMVIVLYFKSYVEIRKLSSLISQYYSLHEKAK